MRNSSRNQQLDANRQQRQPEKRNVCEWPHSHTRLASYSTRGRELRE